MNAGWRVEAKCPHGRTISIPLAILQSLEQLYDPCPEAQVEKAQRQPSLSRKEKRNFRRIAKGLTALNVEQPPSSETREVP
jgi:hypothetical protein